MTVLLGEWEEVQEVYQCCGLTGESGYHHWLPLLPDSCCTLKYPDCGRDALATLSSDFANTFSERIFTTGCVTVFRAVMEQTLTPLFISLGVLALLLSLAQLGLTIQAIITTQGSGQSMIDVFPFSKEKIIFTFEFLPLVSDPEHFVKEKKTCYHNHKAS